MILSGETIRRLCESNTPLIQPFRETYKIDGYSGGVSIAGYDIAIAEDIELGPCNSPTSFQLASTVEKFNLPTNLLFFVTDKSTWARRGITVQNTVAEPGWRGYLTLELINHSQESVAISKGTPIAQAVFQYVDRYTDGYNGKYQEQEAGPQPARYNK